MADFYLETITFGPAPDGLTILTPSLTFKKIDRSVIKNLQVEGVSGTYYVPYTITNNQNSKVIVGNIGPINIIGINIGIGYDVIEFTFVVG